MYVNFNELVSGLMFQTHH